MARKPKDKPADAAAKSKVQLLKEKWNLIPPPEKPAYPALLRVIPTGILALDMLTGDVDPINGNGGFKQYSIVELFGPNQCYKTGTAEHIIRNTMRLYGPDSVFAVFSEKPDKDRMIRFGIDYDNLNKIDAFSEDVEEKLRLAEYALEAVCDFAALEETKVIVIDSAAAFPVRLQVYDPQTKKERPLSEEDAMAARAKVWNRFLTKFKSKNKGSVLIIVNQKRVHISKGMFDMESPIRPNTPAGAGIDFDSNLRISCFAKQMPRKNGETLVKHPVTDKVIYDHYEVTWKIVKNKYGPPQILRELTTEFYVTKYLDKDGTLRQGRFDEIPQFLVWGEYISSLIPECPIKRSGNTWEVGGVSCRSKALALEELAKREDIQSLLYIHLVRNSDDFFEATRPSMEQLLDGDANEQTRQEQGPPQREESVDSGEGQDSSESLQEI